MVTTLKRFILSVACSLLLVPSFAFAQATGWYTCTVNQVGTVDTSNRYVWLTDDGGAFSNKSFRLWYTNIANEQLATLLTAISSSKKVYAYVGNGAMGYVYLKE